MNYGVRRLQPALLLAPAALLSWLHVSSQLEDLAGWSIAATALSVSTSSVFILGPAAAAVAAARSGRLKRARVDEWAPRRPRAIVVADAASPALAAAAAYLFAMIGWAVLTTGQPPGGWGLVTVGATMSAVAVLAAHAAIGAALGLVLPSVAAVPLVLVTGYLWFVWPISIEPFWVRHVTGFRSSCCMIGTDLAPEALVAPAIVATSFITSAALMVFRRSELAVRAVIVIVVLVSGLVAARATVVDLGPDPAQQRTAGLECQGRAAPNAGIKTLCLWGEHDARRSDTEEAALAVAAALRRTSLSVPSVVTEGAVKGSDGMQFGISSRSSPVDIVGSLASSVVGRQDCYIQAPGIADGDLLSVVITWVVLRAEIAPQDVEGHVSEEVLSAVAGVRKRPDDQQVDWFEEQLAVLDSCPEESPQ